MMIITMILIIIMLKEGQLKGVAFAFFAIQRKPRTKAKKNKNLGGFGGRKTHTKSARDCSCRAPRRDWKLAFVYFLLDFQIIAHFASGAKAPGTRHPTPGHPAPRHPGTAAPGTRASGTRRPTHGARHPTLGTRHPLLFFPPGVHNFPHDFRNYFFCIGFP